MIGNRKIAKWLLIIMLVATTVLPTTALAATGDVQGIQIENGIKDIEIFVTETAKQLKLLATIEGSASKNVSSEATWTSSNSQIVKVDQGLITPLKEGEVTITATYKGFSDTIEVKSSYLYDNFYLSQSGKITYELGKEDIEVTATAVDGQKETVVTKDATWKSSNTNVLTVSDGIVTLVGKGTAIITATYKGKTASFTAEVILPYSKIELVRGADKELVQEDLEMLVGDQFVKLDARAQLADNQGPVVITDKATWTTSDEKIAKVSKDGEITPVGIGKATIRVQYLGMSTEIDVYVRTKYEVIIVSPSSEQKLFLNKNVKIEATVRSGANTSLEVSELADWTSSNPLVATVNKGVVTGKATGTSTIKVTYLGLSKDVKVTVYPTITKISTEKSTLELYKGESANLPTVNATTLDDEQQDFGSAVKWSSSNEQIATVEKGKVQALDTGEVVLTAEIGEYKTTLTVTIQEKVLVLLPTEESITVVTGKEAGLPQVTAVRENGDEEDVTALMEWSLTGSNAVIKADKIKGLVKGSVSLKGTYLNQTIKIPVVIEQEVVKIVVETTSIELNINKSKAIKVTGYYANGGTVNLSSKVNWVSSNTDIATVKSSTVKAVTEGSATLNGSYQEKAVKVEIKVVPKLQKLTVSEKQLTLSPGSAKTVTLTALYDTGKSAAVTGSAVWTSSKPGIATVTNGKIEAVAKGKTSIKGQFNGKTVTISVTVK